MHECQHLGEADRKRKPDFKPYTHVDDPRFHFLLRVFLKYVEDWKNFVQNRSGFAQAEKQKMFLTHQIYKGLVMTVSAVIGVTRYLLQYGVSFVISYKFYQDPLEEHFSRHRRMGRENDNPNIFQFGYQENCLRMQRDISLQIMPIGNVQGYKKKDHAQLQTVRSRIGR